jgi:hypothetical protein
MARTPSLSVRADDIDDADEQVPAGASSSSGSSASPTTAAVTEAPAANSGTNQQQLEALLAAIAPNGDTSKLRYTTATKTVNVPNPAAQERNADGTLNPDFKAGTPPTVQRQVEVRTWLNLDTNATVSAEPKADGSYAVTRNSAGNKATTAEEGTTSTTIAEINGGRYGIAAHKDKDGNVAYTYTDLQTGQTIAGLPAAKDKTTTSLTKGADGKTYAIAVGPDGQIIGEPKDVGLPADAKPGTTHVITAGDGKIYTITVDANGKPGDPVDTGIPANTKPDVYNTPAGLVKVDKDGTSSLIYAAPKDPNVKIDKDATTGRWHETKYDPATGQSTVREIKPEGETTAKAPAMGQIPGPGELSAWLWAEKAKLDEAVKNGDVTPEEAIAQMKERREFAQTVVAERDAQQKQQDAAADRAQKDRAEEGANYRQGLSSGTSIYTSVAPKVMDMGAKLLPGNGAVAANGLMAMLQLGQQFAQGLAGPRPTTTVAPDGTVTVQHNPSPAAASEVARPGDPGYGATSAEDLPWVRHDPLTNTPAPSQGPAFTDPNTGAFAIPGSFVTGPTQPAVFRPPPSVPGSETVTSPDQAAALVTQPTDGMPDWAQAQASQPSQPAPSSYGDAAQAVAASDPSFAQAWAEAERRRQQAELGVAA